MPSRDTVCHECERVFYTPATGKCPFCRSNQIGKVVVLDAQESIKLLRGLIREAIQEGDIEAAQALQYILDRHEEPPKSLTEQVFDAITDSYRREYGTESRN